MLIGGLVCLGLAVLVGISGLRTLSRPAIDVTGQVLRAVVPTQFAAAVILGAGGAVAIVLPATTGLVVLIVCIVGAVGTIAAGSWRTARFAARESQQAGCGGGCAGCNKICG